MNDIDPRRRLNLLGLLASVAAILVGALLLIRPSIESSRNSSVGLIGPANKTVQAGDLAPDFELAALDGRRIKLSDLKGQPVLVNFWATWCPPCKAEMPLIIDAYRAHQAGGLRVLAIDTTANDNVQDVKNFVAQHQMPFDVLLDVDDSVGGGWNTLGLPSSYFIDKTGKVVSVRVGQMTEQELNDSLKMILSN